MQRVEQRLHARALFAANDQDADDREDDADAGEDHGGGDEVDELFEGATADERQRGAKGRGGQDRAAVGLVEVGAHARHVAHVVAHVVSDGGRVARVVLGNARLDFAHEVSAHVSRLGVDAAADAREERLCRRAHAKGQHGDGHLGQLVVRVHVGADEPDIADEVAEARGHVGRRVDKLVEDDEPQRDVEQAKADDDEAHHRAGAEGDLQAAVESLGGALGGAAGSVGRGLHADESAQAGEEAAGEEGDGHKGVLQAEQSERDEDDAEDGEDDGDARILLLEVGHRPLADEAGDFLHAIGARRGLFHQAVENRGGGERDQGADGSNPPIGGGGAVTCGLGLLRQRLQQGVGDLFHETTPSRKIARGQRLASSRTSGGLMIVTWGV